MEISDGISRIESNTFSDFNNLKEIKLPESVSFIEENSIQNCEQLSLIIYDGIIPPQCNSKSLNKNNLIIVYRGYENPITM